MSTALTTVIAFKRHRGAMIVYMIVVLSLMLIFASVGVDYGKYVVTRSEMQTASDAAARYAASGLKNVLFGASAAPANAVLAAAANKADGSPVILDPVNDVQLVIWNSAKHTYTVTTDPTQANAVRVTALRTAARGNATQLTFAGIFGKKTCDIRVSSIAALTGDANFTYTVPATSNPFLSGMPFGAVASQNNPHNNPDHAGKTKGNGYGTDSTTNQSPVFAASTAVGSGSSMTFDGVNGNANNDITSSVRYSADGNLGGACHNFNQDSGDMTGTDYYNENNIADMRAPINCLVGVFLNDAAPNKNAAPTKNLDFGTSDQRNFQTISPQLQQMFFIGDGRTDDGAVQHFTVPAGATRLYIATWDAYEWNNNVGSFSCTIHNTGNVSLVQ